jgi:alpha-L-fucosidase
MNWFKEKRLGMFIHWGLYTIPAKHEQYWQRWKIPREEYIKLAEQFDPQKFDPVQWLDLAESAGMEYLCFTTKHHDGFCMWDSKETTFNVMNSPCKKDILGLLAAECHKRNFPLELYYSVVDWHHPAYPNIGRHHEIITDPAQHDMAAYVDYLKAQIKELCTNYGTIHGIWWDMNVPEYKDESVHQLIRELQPQALINNRGFGDGDFSTPERDFDPEDANVQSEKNYKTIECCQSVGINSWGYRKNEDYFSSAYFTEQIDSWLAKGCNYLLNIGPDADGVIPEQPTKIINNIGKWFNPVRESFNGQPERILTDNSLLTMRDGDTIYVHCPAGLTSSTLSLAPLTAEPTAVILMNDNRPLTWTFKPTMYRRHLDKPCLRICNIPVDELSGPAVIKLCFK